MSINRRSFLKLMAMTSAIAAASKANAQASDAPETSEDPVRWDKAPCRFCGTGCHVLVGVQNDRIVGIQGAREADVNKGLLCVKGYHVGLILYGEDRLTTPLLRRNGQLEPITWDEALDVIADRVELDPSGFAYYGSGQWTIPEGYAAQKFMKGGLSCNHIDPNARLCMASAVTGFLATYGVDEPAGVYDDLDVCSTVITWGNNPAEMHPILFSRIIDRRSRGEEVNFIDIGTRHTRTTDHANHFLQFNPNSDLAIANGIMALLLERGSYNAEFVENFCNFRRDGESGPTLFGEEMSFEEFREAVSEYTPERVEEISGVSADDIHMLADLFEDPEERIVSLWCMGVNQHTRGTAMNTLIHGVHLLSGHFGKPGDAPTSLTGQPSACGTAREVGTLAHALPGGRVVANEAHRTQCEDFWNVPNGRISAVPGYHTMAMWNKFCTPASDGGDVHTIWVQVTNPGQTIPNLNRNFEPASRLEEKFLIVSEVYPTATTVLADLVLPSAMWVEKNGIFGNSERRTQQWFRQVMPPGDARDDCWQTIAAARRLFDRGFEGMRRTDGSFLFGVVNEQNEEVPIWEWEHYYDVNVDRELFEEYRLFSRLKHKDLAPYDTYVQAHGLRWPVVESEPGHWRETRWRFAEFDDPYVTEGTEIEFYHSKTNDGKAQIWFRPWEPAPEVPDDNFPFWLGTGRVLEHWHTGTMTMRVPQLRNAMPSAYAEMHPEDAAALGVVDGDLVRIESRRGAIEVPVWTNGRGRPPRGQVFVPFFDERLLINEVTLDEYDPISKQPDYKKCAVSITRVQTVERPE